MPDDQSSIDASADALRRYEIKGRILNEWANISSSQKTNWRRKAKVVIDAYLKHEKER